MFDWLYKLLGTVLSWFSSITGSYALALLLYAFAFKIIFLPFSIKQQKNQIKMAKLTPKIEVIRAKYRGRTDPVSMRKQQEEIMKLQQDEGYSPLAGCLPMLFQLLIILPLYKVIRNPLSYISRLGDDVIKTLGGVLLGTTENIDQITLASAIRSVASEGEVFVNVNNALASHGMKIADIQSTIPSFNLWGLDLGMKPEILSWLVLIPIFATAFQWLSMFVMRKVSGNQSMQMAAQDSQAQMSMRMMDIMFPAMTLFFTFSFSAMMGLYWIYQSILGMIQSIIIAKLMPIPKYTEEELKMMQKAKRQAEKAQKEIIKSQPKYKSLHYIDEDDYDELPDVKTSTPKSANKTLGQDRPEIKD